MSHSTTSTKGATSTVGVDELKKNTQELLRRVQEDGESIEIADQGKVIALLVPPSEDSEIRNAEREETERILADLDRLAEEISKVWPKGVSALDAINDVRRDY